MLLQLNDPDRWKEQLTCVYMFMSLKTGKILIWLERLVLNFKKALYIHIKCIFKGFSALPFYLN